MSTHHHRLLARRPASTRAARSSPPPSPASCWSRRAAHAAARSRRALLAVQAVLFAIGGVPRRPAHAVRRAVPDRGPAAARRRRASSRTPAAALRPGRRPRLRLVGLVGFARRRHRARAGRHRVRPGAALLNAVVRLLPGLRDLPARSSVRPPADPQTPRPPRRNRRTRKVEHMSRDTALVSAQWVEDHLDDPKVVLVEVDEDTTAYDKGHIQGAIKLDWTTDLQDQVRRDFVNKAQFEALLLRAGRRQRRHRRALRRQQQLVRRLRLLVLQALRPRRRQAARRRPQEVGARQPRADRRAAARARRRRTPRRSRTPRSAPSATRSSPRSACKNLVDVRSPDEYAGRLLAPAHLPQEQAQRAGHIPTAANVPWSKAANDDGTFKSDDELKQHLHRRRRRLEQGHHRLLPHRRALLAHLVRAQGAARPAEREELRRLLDRVRLAGRRARGPR